MHRHLFVRFNYFLRAEVNVERSINAGVGVFPLEKRSYVNWQGSSKGFEGA